MAEPVPLPEHIAEAFWSARGLLDTYDHKAELVAAFAAATADDIKALCPGVYAEIQASALESVASDWDRWGRVGIPVLLRRAAALRDQT